MLFLFNSAGRVGYVENVLNTLFLPQGSENVYQYSWNSGPYIHADIRQGTLNPDNYNETDVLIVFVNKEKDPYEYIPLRKATFLKKEDADGRAYFTVIMGEYCSPKDKIENFSNFFSDTFTDKVFKKNQRKVVGLIQKKSKTIRVIWHLMDAIFQAI